MLLWVCVCAMHASFDADNEIESERNKEGLQRKDLQKEEKNQSKNQRKTQKYWAETLKSRTTCGFVLTTRMIDDVCSRDQPSIILFLGTFRSFEANIRHGLGNNGNNVKKLHKSHCCTTHSHNFVDHFSTAKWARISEPTFLVFSWAEHKCSLVCMNS